MCRACTAYHQGEPAREPGGLGRRKQEPQARKPSLDPYYSNEQHVYDFGHYCFNCGQYYCANCGGDFGDFYAYNGQGGTEEGSTGQEEVEHMLAGPS